MISYEFHDNSWVCAEFSWIFKKKFDAFERHIFGKLPKVPALWCGFVHKYILRCKVEVTLSPYSDLVAVADALCAILFSLQCSVTPKMKIWAGRLLKAYLESFLKRDRVYVFDGADHSDKLSCFKPVAEGEWFLPCNRTPSSFSGVSSPQGSQDVEDSPSRPPSQKEIRR